MGRHQGERDRRGGEKDAAEGVRTCFGQTLSCSAYVCVSLSSSALLTPAHLSLSLPHIATTAAAFFMERLPTVAARIVAILASMTGELGPKL